MSTGLPRWAEQGHTFIDNAKEMITKAAAHIGKCALRVSVIAGLAASALAAEQATDINAARADEVYSIGFANDYPHIGARAYDAAQYEWWVDENGDGAPSVTAWETDNDESVSPRGYGYRNCTDGVAYWAGKYLAKNVGGWGHAKDWDASAFNAGHVVKEGDSNNIEPGDIAQSDDGSYGHVGMVTDVFKDNSGNVTKVKVAEMNMLGTGQFSHTEYSDRQNGRFVRNSSGLGWDHFIDVNGMGGTPKAETRPVSSTNLPWIFETMEGDRASLSGFDAKTGQTPAAAVFGGQLYVLSYEASGGNLRLAKTTPGWSYSTLDGIPGNGRRDGDVGRTPSLVAHDGSMHAFYYGVSGGDLRHAVTVDGTNWRLEDLDGNPGSVLGRDRNVGQTPSAIFMPDGTLHVAYRDATNANLILATARPGQPWTSTVLEGDPNSLSGKDGDIGHDPVLVNYGGVLHIFYYDASGGNLRHAWKSSAGWRFEDLDGTPGSICGKDSDLGKNPAALSHGGTLQAFAYDQAKHDLRHYWSDQKGWHCETLEGDAHAILGEGEAGGHVGAMPSFVSLGGHLQGLAKETKWGSLRHYWTDKNGWHSENFDGLGGSPSGRVSGPTGDDPLATKFGNGLQFFWYGSNKEDLRHAVPRM